MSAFRMWQCLVCGFIYDEAKGWPDDGIPPGTRWEDVPEDWLCPDCGVGKSDFQMVEIGASQSAAEKEAEQEKKPASKTKAKKKSKKKAKVAAKNAVTKKQIRKPQNQQWECMECGFVYDEKQGWLEDGIKAGTRWGEISKNWFCPDCGADQSDFKLLDKVETNDIVVIGSGLAAYTFVKEFRKKDKTTTVVMITSDDGHYYSKPQMSTGYTNQKRADELVAATAEEMAKELDVQIRVFTTVTQIDTVNQSVVANQQSISYAKLVLAWGAQCFTPPIQGDGLSEVYQVNDLLDYSRFRTALVGKSKVLVIGAGLIGSEYANDLANGGFELEAVDPLAGPLATLLLEQASQAVQRGLESMGVKYHFGTVVERIERKSNQGVIATLANGKTIEADIVLSAVGVRPRINLAKQANIETNRGIITNRLLETSAPNVYALGDCAEVGGHVLYYVLPLMECARSLASTLSGKPQKVIYKAMPVKVKLPACPTSVLPPPTGIEGDWQIVQQKNNTRALFYDADNVLRGFALTGEYAAEALSLAKNIPDLMA